MEQFAEDIVKAVSKFRSECKQPMKIQHVHIIVKDSVLVKPFSGAVQQALDKGTSKLNKFFNGEAIISYFNSMFKSMYYDTPPPCHPLLLQNTTPSSLY
jgi:hypothetical protein